VQLGDRQGFFVVEARRGNVGEQVWINRTRVGLLTKETPNELLVYATDLGTGAALARMRVQFVVNGTFEVFYTDAHGIIRWTRNPRPVFAIAQWGPSYTFASFLPQAPLPASIVGVRTDTAVVHAGSTVHVAGFARARVGGVLRPAHGSASITMRLGAGVVAQSQVPLDAAGAFGADLPVPQNAQAGDYAVLAQVGPAVGGATVHVDADANGLSLEVANGCDGTCNAADDVPIEITSSRPGVDVHVRVVRSPHVYVGYSPDDVPWGTSVWLDKTVTTDGGGHATALIAHPTDGLSSTYGVRVDSGGASAVTQMVVPTSRDTIRIALDRSEQTLGTPVNFDVYANEIAGGMPSGGSTVQVQLQHGTSVQQQQLVLDGDGHAHGTFSSAPLGTNFIFASLQSRGATASDAGQVDIVPQATQDTSLTGSSALRVTLDRQVYHADDDVQISAELSGATGDALLTLESASGTQSVVTEVRDGRATATLHVRDEMGDVRAGAAMVQDGSIAWTNVPVSLDAPGRPVTAALDHAAVAPASALLPGGMMQLMMKDAGHASGTAFIRISRGAPTGGAQFESAPTLLAVGLTATEVTAPEGRTWHPWVDSTGEHAQVIGFERRSSPPQNLSLEQADTEAVSWTVLHDDGSAMTVQLPAARGRYTVSVLVIDDDGRVISASEPIVVQ
jgi:hypothetical protein